MLKRVNGVAYSYENKDGKYQIMIHNWKEDACISFQLDRTEYDRIEIFVQAVLHTVMGNYTKVKEFQLTQVPEYKVSSSNTLLQLSVLPSSSDLIRFRNLQNYLQMQPTGKSFLKAFPCGDDNSDVLKEYVSKNHVFMCEGKVMIMIDPWQAAIAQVKENNKQLGSEAWTWSCVMS